MLFRSSAITSMSNLPQDVIDAFVKQACEGVHASPLALRCFWMLLSLALHFFFVFLEASRRGFCPAWCVVCMV